MITLLNVLTGERWDLPDTASLQPLHISYPPYPPGEYDVKNGSGAPLTVVYDSVIPGLLGSVAGNPKSTVPAAAMWNVCTNENTRSWRDWCPDNSVWRYPGSWRGGWRHLDGQR